jgi:hypothetical protein
MGGSVKEVLFYTRRLRQWVLLFSASSGIANRDDVLAGGPGLWHFVARCRLRLSCCVSWRERQSPVIGFRSVTQ